MESLLIFIGVGVIVLILIFIIARLKNYITGGPNDSSRPDHSKKPINKKDNDKIIVVSNISNDDIKDALNKFCNLYNKKYYDALPRLAQLNNNSYAVTFPYDIDFVTFCFAVNFLKYPIDIKTVPQVLAWATTKETDKWIADKSMNKKVMLFLADVDKEYDNVFLTTSDNIGYKLGFAGRDQKKELDMPNKEYIDPSVDINTLKEAKFEDFE